MPRTRSASGQPASAAVGQFPNSALSGPVAPRCSEGGKISPECAVTRAGLVFGFCGNLVLAVPQLGVRFERAGSFGRRRAAQAEALDGREIAMRFNPAVREQALVAAARHCCVCRRYRGVKIEVHHIVPEASGGTSDVDNAIALCFDCHTDAGHYKPEHPRGTKFSPGELRRHREVWYDIVRSGNVAPAPEQTLHCRYLVCKSFDIIGEIASGNLERLPVERPHLAKTPAGRFLEDVVKAHPAQYRNDQEWGDHFATVAEYLRVHPNVVVRERSSAYQFPYFQAVRVPSAMELEERVAPADGITRMLLGANVRPEEIAYALAYSEVCGDDRFQEVYRLRPLWAVYLAVTNVDERPATLESLLHHVDEPNGLGYRGLWARESQGTSAHVLPRVGLPEGATAVIPLAALLGPLWPDRFDAYWTDSCDLSTDQRQILSHGDLSAETVATSVIGPALWPRGIRLAHGGKSVEYQVHELDLENVYTLSRYWVCGSCPHLFFEGSSPRAVAYGGELFARMPRVSQEHLVVVPDGVTALTVAELEDETTVLERVDVNGVRVRWNVTLTKGSVLRIKVRAGDNCRLRGHYDAPVSLPSNPWRRNEIVDAFTRGAV